jgi:amino acid adenylation domain-containing protein
MDLLGSIARTFREYPDRLALVAADGELTYRALEGVVGGIAAELRSRRAGARIGVLTGDDLGTYAAILAVLASGAAYVPLNRKNPPARNAMIVAQAELDLVLASRPSNVLDEIRDAAGRPIDALYTADVAARTPLHSASPAPDDLAYLFFTSGTTGVPKGVPISHRNLNAFAAAVIADPSYAFGPEDRFLQMFELTFDLSVMSLLAPLAVGASCHVVPAVGVASLHIARLLDERALTVALMVPSVLSYLRRYLGELRFPALRHSLFCGEALSHSLTEEWAACVPQAHIRNVYGPTEATIFCTEFNWDARSSAEQSRNDIVPIGRPLAGTVLRVVDDRGMPVPAGTQGELCLSGPQVATGYWRDPVRSRAVFVDTGGDGVAYRTGDLAMVNAQGNYLFRGRADAQIQVDGHRVELGEVEHHLRSFLDGAAVAAAPFRTPDGRQEFVAFIERAADEERPVLEYLRTRLPDYMLPRRVVSVPTLPINLNGKVDRKELLARFLKEDAGRREDRDGQ